MSSVIQQDLSIIIVNWNTKNELRACLSSLYSKPSELALEVIVVDNASSDGSADMVEQEYPQVILIRNSENVGYARANNLGIRRSSSQNVLLLNSDTIVNPDVMKETLELLRSDSKIGVLGCKLIGTDGKIQESFNHQYPFGPTVGNPGTIPEDGLVECALVWGAYMMVKREAIDQVGMLDDDFFMFYEDVEWCWRMYDAGWKIVYDTNHSIKHLCRASCGQVKPRDIDQYLFISEKIMYKKRLPYPRYKVWWRKRFLYHIRCIAWYSLLSMITRSEYSRYRVRHHLDGYRILTSSKAGG
ncbi:MAG TPA: glycosyltransferase family 2 protein [Armatimonadota bacterium]|nr:glycosyltransferase family 2 protein [Armatimonadota bacterium]HPP75837.1 glycosyltransferase family 2 protein [Armatimonadota bacterium]